MKKLKYWDGSKWNYIDSNTLGGLSATQFLRKDTSGTVRGNLTVTGTITGSQVFNAVFNDYAELFKKGEELEPGDVVSINSNVIQEEYIKSKKAYSNLVVGVVSDEYGHILGGKNIPLEENLKEYAPIGLAGRVRVKVFGPIAKGQLLVSSHIPGVAMANKKNILGTIIGKALESYDGKEGIKRIKMQIKNL